MVVISLVVAQIFLPLLTPKAEDDSVDSHLDFREAYILIKEFGMKYIHKQTTPENSMIAGNLIRQYTMRGRIL